MREINDITRALRAPSYQQDSAWHDPKTVTYVTKPRALLEEAADKIEGLEDDLFLAVSTAYRRGAVEWTRLNYPEWYKRLEPRA